MFNLFLEERAAWEASLYVGLACATTVGALMGWEQWHMPQQEAVEVNWLWHVPPWAIATISTMMLVFAYFDPTNLAAFYVAGTACQIPLALWCFVAIVFRRFF